MKKDFQKGDLVLFEDRNISTGSVTWLKGTIIDSREILLGDGVNVALLFEIQVSTGRVTDRLAAHIKLDLKTIRTNKLRQILK